MHLCVWKQKLCVLYKYLVFIYCMYIYVLMHLILVSRLSTLTNVLLSWSHFVNVSECQYVKPMYDVQTNKAGCYLLMIKTGKS